MISEPASCGISQLTGERGNLHFCDKQVECVFVINLLGYSKVRLGSIQHHRVPVVWKLPTNQPRKALCFGMMQRYIKHKLINLNIKRKEQEILCSLQLIANENRLTTIRSKSVAHFGLGEIR